MILFRFLFIVSRLVGELRKWEWWMCMTHLVQFRWMNQISDGKFGKFTCLKWLWTSTCHRPDSQLASRPIVVHSITFPSCQPQNKQRQSAPLRFSFTDCPKKTSRMFTWKTGITETHCWTPGKLLPKTSCVTEIRESTQRSGNVACF